MREILKKKPADLDWIQKQGLLSVKLAQIFALRSDLIGVEKCRQLQQLYQHAASIPTEDVFANLESRAPEGFFDAFENIEKVPLAAASVGQVHRGKLKTGEDVVIKIIKNQNSRTFRRDVERMRRWLRIFLFFNRKLRRVGNPVALLNHVADYTTRELDLRNEIKGAEELEKIKHEIGSAYPSDTVSEISVKGRNLSEGVPRTFTLNSNEILDSLQEPLQAIANALKSALEQTPPELGSDIAERGIVLTGGGALLQNIEKLLAEETGLPVLIAENPLTCVARGGGRIIDILDEQGADFFELT